MTEPVAKKPKTVEARLARLEVWVVCLGITLVVTMYFTGVALGKANTLQELMGAMVKRELLMKEAEHLIRQTEAHALARKALGAERE